MGSLATIKIASYYPKRDFLETHVHCQDTPCLLFKIIPYDCKCQHDLFMLKLDFVKIEKK